MRATVNDIARATGLSISTVSRALEPTGKYRITEETRRRVREAAKQLNYRPNLIGRALVAGSSRLIGLISRAPFSEYYTQFAEILTHRLSADGYCLVNSLAGPPPDPSDVVRSHVTQDWLFGADGIFMLDPSKPRDHFIQQALDQNIPVVGIGAVRSSGADSVHLDLCRPTVELLETLIAQGRRRMTLVIDDGSLSESRGDAYRQVTAAAGLPMNIRSIEEHNRESGMLAAIQEIQERGLPDVFVCVNDAVAVGCLAGLAQLGVRVPEDVAITGCDGIEAAKYLSCPITTIVQSYEEACVQAWAFLKSRIEGYSGPHREQSFDSRVEFRRSTESR